jgi:hypothetical protein
LTITNAVQVVEGLEKEEQRNAQHVTGLNGSKRRNNMMFLIYIVSVVDDIKILCIIIGGVSGLSAVFCAFALGDPYEGDIITLKKIIKVALLLFITLLPLGILIPSSKGVVAMYLVPKIAENKKIQEITGKAGSVLEKKLDQWFEDFSEDEPKK